MADVVVEVAGTRLGLSNLAKVLYPQAGTTKGEVIEYYTRVAPVLLPLVRDRAATRKRWPDGVQAAPFFEKNAPRGTPDWVRTVTLDSPGSRSRERVTYVVVDDLPTLVWCANLAALELHVPQWQVGPRGGVRRPDRLVVDLDPGAPAALPECLTVAGWVRARLAADGLAAHPTTSGSKGMQLYAPIAAEQDSEVVSAYAKRLAEELEAEHPDLVTSKMTRALRPGKVFVDWSQNSASKTTVTPYSLRGRERPTVATPLTWDEVGAGRLVAFGTADVLDRLERLGDLMAPLSDGGPRVPA